MKPRFDVAVIGLGAHGSAIAAHCAAAGLSVCGIDRQTPPHSGGSHHGESRIIRKAYYEHPSYVPLLERAYVLWDALAKTTRETLFQRTGGLMIGPPDGELVPGALASARAHRLEHTWLSSATLAQRFPEFIADSNLEAVFEPEAGVLRPEACIRAHLHIAREAGAVLCPERNARVVSSSAQEVEIELVSPTAEVELIRARRCVVAAGAGLADIGLSLSPRIIVERQVVAHFYGETNAAARLRSLPIFAVEEADGRFFYGFPDLGTGVKVAQHHGGETSFTDVVDMNVRPDDIDKLRAFLRRHLPSVDGPLGATAVCRYTNTVDGHFVIDESNAGMTIVSACSGHGFKFAPVLGEIITARVCNFTSTLDIGLFLSARKSPLM